MTHSKEEGATILKMVELELIQSTVLPTAKHPMAKPRLLNKY